MRELFRTPTAASLLAIALLNSCGEAPAAQGCSTPSDCPGGSWCRSGTCVSNQPPVAAIHGPAWAKSNTVVTFHAWNSHDPDGEDSVVGWTWGARAASRPASSLCEPAITAAAKGELSVVFPCSGLHEISLEVRDGTGAASALATHAVDVTLSAEPPTVAAGPDLATDHRCAGTPLLCTLWSAPATDVALSSVAGGPPFLTFDHQWSVELPPELTGKAAPLVTFHPSATVPSPRVTVETAGTAISGTYTFRIVVTDSRGMIAVATQRLTVGNRVPVLVGGGTIEIPHRFSTAPDRFVATGSIPPATWSDPDGDPVISLGFATSQAGTGGGTFTATDRGDHADLAAVVAYGGPSDASFLIGPEVRRAVSLTVADPNGGQAATSWGVTVGNRPARITSPVAAISVVHRFDAAASLYRADAALSTYADDDGDPVTLTVTGSPVCGSVALAGGVAQVACSQPWGGDNRNIAAIVGTHGVVVASRDPFEAGPTQATSIAIGNRPPRLTTTGTSLGASCPTYPTCCEPGAGPGTCVEWDFTWNPIPDSPVLVVDDDGDPLDVLATPGAGSACLAAAPNPGGPCPAGGCTVALSLCGGRSKCGNFTPGGELSLTAGDGASTVGGTVWVEAACAF